MATTAVKIRGLVPGTLDNDIVVILNRESRMERFGFAISPFGTDDAAVVETLVDDSKLADFSAAVIAKEGVTIVNNPAWEDVKTDTNDDGVSDSDGTRYGWGTNGPLYEIV